MLPRVLRSKKTQADDEFWNKKIIPSVRAPITKVKKTTTRPKTKKKRAAGEKTAVEEMLDLDDTEDEPENDQAGAPEKQQFESQRRTRSAGSGDLLSGLQDTPAPRKRPAEETAGSSGESTTFVIPFMRVNPGAQAKRRKTTGSGSGIAADAPARGPSSEPAPAAPAAAASASSAPPVEPAAAKAAVTSDALLAPKPAAQNAAPAAPASSTAGPDSTPEVVVTGAAYSPPARNVLTRHVDGSGSSIPTKLELGARLLDNLSADELYAGFLSRFNAHRGEELQLVNQLKKKYEETTTGLRDEAAASQTAKEVVEEKLCAAIQKLGELETELSTVRKAAETQEGELVKRAEEAENRLKVVTDELAGLTKHVIRMTEAIFGKRSRQLSFDSILKLKAIYTLTEQLYCGAVCTIMAMMGKKSIPGSLKDVLDLLSILPQHFYELRKSAVRKGAIAGLSRALAFAPELTTEDMMGGFPSLKYDGTEFSEADYKKCLKDSRPLTSILVEETDLSTYQAAYSSMGQRIGPPTYAVSDLIPQSSKQPFDSELDPSPFFEGAQFESLIHCN